MAIIRKKPFGRLSDGTPVELYTLRNTKGTEVGITTYGARLVSWRIMGRQAKFIDIVLGYEDAATYEKDTDTAMGAIVGRHANRIADGKAVIDGREYQLECNTGSKGQNHLHGASGSLQYKLWTAEETYEGLKLTCESPDGESGYPGNMTVSVLYSLSNDNELSIQYEATSDADTVCNLTNHSYFNLDGYETGSVLDQKVQLFADQYTWADKESLPDGRILSVEGTPMDFREPRTLGLSIDDAFDQLQMAGGYDQNWVLRGDAPMVEMKPGMFGYDPHCPIDYLKAGLHKAAYAESEKTGLTLMCYTTLPGIQLYTGNFLDGSFVGKKGAVFPRRSGFCLETQYYPNAFANPSFPQPVLKKGEVWKAQTVYVLSFKD